MKNNNLQLYVVSHTHWDREWYQTFQQFRVRLVRMIDDLLDLMEKDDKYQFFTFDGQTIVIEDYLEIRPENKERLFKLIRSGRIDIGPWYVMPDEFLVSGESLIRNLKFGIDICKDIGVPYLKNGYVIDIFGHNSQMPQLLNQFDIHSALLFRGIADYPKNAFYWSAPDGSKVMTYRLDADRSYSNFYFSVRNPFEGKEATDEDIINGVQQFIEYSKSAAVSDCLLMMDGIDHIDAEPRLPNMLKMINQNMPDVNIKQVKLETFFKQLKKTTVEQLETLEGPLYHLGKKGLNNWLLKNVLSSNVHIKQDNDFCETLLERLAEPLDFATGLFKGEMRESSDYRSMEPRKGFIKEAWKLLLQNHPHDSICGCSITNVHKDNDYRFRQVKQIGELLVSDATVQLVRNINTDGKGKEGAFVLFSAAQSVLCGTVIADVAMPTEGNQFYEIYDNFGKKVPYQVIAQHSFLEHQSPLNQIIGFIPKTMLTLALETSIPANGYTTFTYDDFRQVTPALKSSNYSYLSFEEPNRYLGSMRTAVNRFDNGVLKITIAANGTLDVVDKESGAAYHNMLIFEDSADVGDGWNYKKLAMDSAFYTMGGHADIAIEADGPLVAIVKIIHHLDLPVDVDRSGVRSDRTERLKIITKIQILKHSKIIGFTTFVDNRKHSSHRLRALFPTCLQTDCYYTKTPFDMQKWAITPEDWSHFCEEETGVFPSQGVTFLSDEKNGFALYTKGLYEVGVLDQEDRTLAVTLFRSFPHETGTFEADMSNLHREMAFEYAIDFSCATPCEALIKSEIWKLPVKAVSEKKHDGVLPNSQSFLSIESESEAVVLSALIRDGAFLSDRLADVIRLYDGSGKGEKGYLIFAKNVVEAYYLDLNGQCIKKAEIKSGKIIFEIEKNAIVTIGFFMDV